MRRLDDITNLMHINLGELWETGRDREDTKESDTKVTT